MSTFNNGGGVLKSANLPAAFQELAHLLNAAEIAASTIDEAFDNVDVAYDLDAKTMSVAATLPIAPSVDANGQVVITASSYFSSGVAFNAGSGGTLKSNTLPKAFLELAQSVQNAEQAVALNPPNNITIAMDLEAKTATIAATMPITSVTTSTGKVEITAVDYLP